jgi:phosphohistidine phosphatase SixA
VRTLHFLRHATSSWDDATLPDHDRPLAPRGARAARRIAHNPGLQDLAIDLASEGDTALLNQLRTKFPTGALATFDFDVTWAELRSGHAHLTHLVTPKDLS